MAPVLPNGGKEPSPLGLNLIYDRHQDIEYIFNTLADPGMDRRNLALRLFRWTAKTTSELTGRHGVVRSWGVSCYGAMAAIAVAWGQPAFALDPRYPDWPCQQLKVPEISIASVWNGPPIDTIDTTKPADPKQTELVARLAARRTPIEDARKLIAD